MRFPSALAPLAHGQFAWFCTATTIAGLGAWIQSTASAWVMTELAPDAMMVSLVQAAAQLPVLLLVVPAGALADLVNRRRYLILTNLWMFFIAALLAGLYALGQVGPSLLLVLTALLAAGAALNSPAWSSSLTLMVPRNALAQAVAVNTMSFNVARAVGPSLGGILVAVGGAALAFAANAVSFAIVAIICGAVLSLSAAPGPHGLTAEPKGRAILLGVRYVAAEPNLRAAMVRSLAFYGMASAIWALLPLYVRQVLGLSAASYGALLGATGAGALVGGLVMPHIRAWLSRDGEVMLGGILCSATLIPVALLSSPAVAVFAMVVFGFGWILATSNLTVAVQLASAPWVRARGTAVYQAVFSAGMGIGAIVWGWLAETAGLPGTLLAAGLGGVGMAVFGRAYALSDEIVDPSLPPSVTPPTVVAHEMMARDLISLQHPVVVAIAYKVAHEDADAFNAAMMEVAKSRRRNGATAWLLGRDVEEPERWLECFRLPDWLELQRGIARVNLMDATATQAARAFHRGKRPPQVSVLAIEQAN